MQRMIPNTAIKPAMIATITAVLGPSLLLSSQSSQSPVSICPELAGLFVLVVERRGWVFLLFMFKWYTTMIYLYLRAEIDRQLSLTKGSCLLKK